MTCIVGLVDKGTVWIGGDSCGIDGWTRADSFADEKVFLNGDFAIGYCGSYRMGQLLQHALSPPAIPAGQDARKFMATSFVDEVRKCFKAGGCAKKVEEVETAGNFLVGFGGRLFEVQEGYQVLETRRGYTAIGCGGHCAVGVLYATRALPPRRRVLLALQAAEALYGGVRRPFRVVKAPRVE